ncbi:hypothetical protein SSP531S_04420 [Streptomyces spongiicola]|uniref:Tryptophan-rich sensory protein n=1 Tax=Streptomyces spongiicola TaxID=1690221 RepID=A0A2S1Z6I2_9ACTN|nr:hypothetical protein [Streptomyces spongiicola]AWK11976.1 hypothetical protein DDQ41_27065 [Streptomyces spongiicola]GBP99047.1 hypothetical protein SSP531S_04420 [Streptomyces spongiicola]
MQATPLTRSARRAVPWRAVMLVLAIGQVVSSLLSRLYGGEFTTADRPGEPPIVPVGWAFSIWTLVELLCIAYAVWALPDRRPDPVVRNRLAVPLSVVFAGFSCWLVAAEVAPVWGTVVVFAVMIAGLLRAVSVALAHRSEIAGWGPVPRGLLWWMLGVYAGWSSIAVWVNLTTALAGSGAPVDGAAGIAGQCAVLAGATATAVAVVRWTRGLLPYALAAGWGLLTASLGALGAGQPALAGIAAAGLAVVAVAAVRARGRRTPAHR